MFTPRNPTNFTTTLYDADIPYDADIRYDWIVINNTYWNDRTPIDNNAISVVSDWNSTISYYYDWVNGSMNVTSTSQLLVPSNTTISILYVTNTGDNPVYIRYNELWPAVIWEWTVLMYNGSYCIIQNPNTWSPMTWRIIPTSTWHQR